MSAVRAAQALSRAKTCLHQSRYAAAASAALEGLSHTCHSSHAATVRLQLLNARANAQQMGGLIVEAHDTLEEALDLALTTARSGAADDDYIGIGGCLIDLAANHIKRGSTDTADAALRRAQYMLKRAYRPSSSAHACLLNVRGLLHEARGEHQSAFDAHQESHSALVGCSADQPHSLVWVQAARSGSVWALLQMGKVDAAQMLAAADVARLHDDRAAAWPPRERHIACSLSALTDLQRAFCGRPPEKAGVREAALELRRVAADMAELVDSDDHEDVTLARRNAEVASRLDKGLDQSVEQSAAEDQDGLILREILRERHWQPALGVGLAAPFTAPDQTTTQGDNHRWSG